jgi:protein tyrosine phosphatase (PTP) superfamily phosphohydrolase (DUF442 family)
MDYLTFIFSHVCGEGRAFVVDGAALPVCERCFGLYAGAALTALWLLASGIARRGLPHTREALAQVGMLLAAMAGGLHWIDAGPTWRLLCGLWTGHVAMVWLVAAAAHMRLRTGWHGHAPLRGHERSAPGGHGHATARDHATRQESKAGASAATEAAWPRRDRLQMLTAGPALAALAFAFTSLGPGGWWLWAALAVLGAASLASALAWAGLAALRWGIVRGVRGTQPSDAVPAAAGEKSTVMGTRDRTKVCLGLALAGLACAAAGCTVPSARPADPVTGIPGFVKVSDELYRSAQPNARGFGEARELGVRTVVSLRTLASDRHRLRGLGMKYVHIACNSVHPEEEDVLAFLKIVTDPENQPVLVHCHRGADRCGMMTAAYRVVVQGWDKRRALEEMHDLGFNDGLAPIERYIERLDPDALRQKLAAVKEPQAKFIP